MEIWQLSLLIFFACLYGVCSGVDIEACSPAVKNEACNITCSDVDLNQSIEFKCNGSSRGQCTVFICPSNMIKEGGNKLHLQIPMLSYTSDNCDWSCTSGITSSAPAKITIYSGILSPLNLTGQMDTDGVKLTAIADCLYPYYPIVDVEYSIQSVGPYASLNAQVDLQSSTTPGGCSDAIERRVTANFDVPKNHEELAGKSVFFRMKFSQYQSGPENYTNVGGPFSFEGLTIPSSTISSDMSTTVSEVPPPLVTTSSAGLSQEIVITITISSIIAAGVLIFLTVLVVNLCRQKNRETPAKNKENRFATEQGNFTKKDASKSSTEPRKSKFSGKRNTKQESISLNKFKHTQFNNSQAPKDRMYDHCPQTTEYMHLNNSGNHNVFNHSHAERNMILYGNRHDNYPKSHSRPNHRMVYLSPYPGHNEGMFQYYRANNLYQGQQMYQSPYVAQYDRIKDKPVNERSFKGRTYERNWDFLY